jgi:hypothetical protein
MLGLSLSKILFTILIAVVVWKGFALVGVCSARTSACMVFPTR